MKNSSVQSFRHIYIAIGITSASLLLSKQPLLAKDIEGCVKCQGNKFGSEDIPRDLIVQGQRNDRNTGIEVAKSSVDPDEETAQSSGMREADDSVNGEVIETIEYEESVIKDDDDPRSSTAPISKEKVKAISSQSVRKENTEKISSDNKSIKEALVNTSMQQSENTETENTPVKINGTNLIPGLQLAAQKSPADNSIETNIKNRAEITEISERNAKIEEKVDINNKAISSINDDMKKLNETADDHEERLSNLDNFSEVSKHNMGIMRGNMKKIHTAVVGHQKDISDIIDDTSGIKDRLTLDESKIEKAEEAITKNSSDISGIVDGNAHRDKIISDQGNEIEKSKNRISADETKIEELDKGAKENNVAIKSQSDALGIQSSRLDMAKKEMEAIDGKSKIHEKTIAAYGERIKNNEDSIGIIAAKSDNLDRDLKTHDNLIEDTRNNLKKSNEISESHGKRIEILGHNVEVNGGKIEELNSRAAENEENMKSYGRDLGAQSIRTERVEKAIEAGNERVKAHGDIIAGHDDRMSKNEHEIRGIRERGDNIDRVIKTHSDAIGEVRNDLGKLSDSVDSQEIRIGSTERKIAGHRRMIDSLVEDGNAQGRIIAGHDERIDRLDGRMIKADAENRRQDESLDNHERRIAGHQQMIDDLIEVGSAQGRIIAGHGERIDGLDERMIRADADSRRRDESLNNHEQRIARQEGAIRDVREGAVFYDRDSEGRKTGSLTLTGVDDAPVRLRNVARGREAGDAANVEQVAGVMKSLGGGARIGLDGSIVAPSYMIAGKSYDDVGGALQASDRLGVRYESDENGKATNRIVLSGDGTGAPVGISNVAAARRSGDATNYGQVLQLQQDSFDYTDRRIGALETSTNRQFAALSGDIAKNRQEARSGIASALAAAGLRFDDRPGKGSIATSVGSFKGATAVAAGLGYTTESGNWRLNAAVAHSFATNDTSWNVGASWTFD